VRILAATNRSLVDEVAAGRFREDLYYRLNVLEIRIPPLRERREDIPLLANFLLTRLGEKNRKQVRNLSPEFVSALMAYTWPGNVRELENVLERGLILSRTDTLTPDLLPPQMANLTEDQAATPGRDFARQAVEEAEKDALVRALAANDGHREKTADALGVSRRTLQYKLKKYGLIRR